MFDTRFPRSIWDEFDRLEREMGQLVDAYTGLAAPEPDFPAINVWVNQDEAVVMALLPGIEAKTLELSVVGDSLTLGGERKLEKIAENARMHRQERLTGRFTRSIELPFPIQSERVEAHLEKGVLRVVAPRAEEDKPKKITVKMS